MNSVADTLAPALDDARRRTLTLIDGLDPAALEQVHSPLLSPLAWDLGHIAVFEDLWVSRTFGTPMLAEELVGLYDADETPRAERGSLPVLAPAAALDLLGRVRARTLELLGTRSAPHAQARLELVVRHELQHHETMMQTCQIGGLRPGLSELLDPDLRGGEDGLELVPLAGGEIGVGADPDLPFAYDNERPRHVRELAPFLIGRCLVSNHAWSDFVDAGGYARRELWTAPGWAWREQEDVQRPLYWNADGTTQRFGVRQALDLDAAVSHISFWEADAFTRHHGARLPTEFEWEAAATVEPHGSGQLVKHLRHSLWQWTQSRFDGYPGFRADPYPEYSEQFFGQDFRVLRGGAWLSARRVATVTFRNWDHPQRRQIFTGLRLARDL